MNGADGVVQDYLCNGPNLSLLIFYYFRSYAVPHSFRLAFSTSVTHYLSCIVHNGARRIQHDNFSLNEACAKVVHCSHSGLRPRPWCWWHFLEIQALQSNIVSYCGGTYG